VKWVTRQNANVDRIACPWLISKFFDADAEFLFVPAAEVRSVAEREGALPYDVPDVELGHIDGRCSFESIIVKYEIKDPALDLLAKIVHGADVSEDRDIVPEAAGLYAIANDLPSSTARRTTKRSGLRPRCTTRSTPGAKARVCQRRNEEVVQAEG
jgi:hypothetical protein